MLSTVNDTMTREIIFPRIIVLLIKDNKIMISPLQVSFPNIIGVSYKVFVRSSIAQVRILFDFKYFC